ncbi:hypothetical protein [Actinacidiphila paucisporea]|uniref:Uncharacterized protein n=1 Tax=Actinacidiphila paucisporea TaxID=310782 RepID=A0A1M7N5S9_9ACTN|nr:hypothetical protein SAMN05216499_117132 [Actinacidiphila paucisporea]
MDPESWGPTWRKWDGIDAAEAEARGIYAPVSALSDGAPGAVVIAPGDIRGTRLIPEKRGGACCGLDGADGPNVACLACGSAMATRIDDCSLWQAVWLAPGAVRSLSVGLRRVGPGPFRHALVRLPAARSPWVRTLLENLAQQRFPTIF